MCLVDKAPGAFQIEWWMMTYELKQSEETKPRVIFASMENNCRSLDKYSDRLLGLQVWFITLETQSNLLQNKKK